MKNGIVYAEFCLFCFDKNNQHVHHLIGCSKKKAKKKIRPTYPISKKSVTGNIQLIFLGLNETFCSTMDLYLSHHSYATKFGKINNEYFV